MSKYAEGTKVPIENSKAEIEKTLRRYGIEQMAMPMDFKTGAGEVMFSKAGRWYKFQVKPPSREQFARTARTRRNAAQVDVCMENELKRRWRVLALQIKAKCEAVSSELTDFESEFFSSTLLPNKQTALEHFKPAVDEAYKSGNIPTPGFNLPAPEGK